MASTAHSPLLRRLGGFLTIVVGVLWILVAATICVVAGALGGGLGLAVTAPLLALSVGVVVLGVRLVRRPRRTLERVASAAALLVTAAVVVGVVAVSVWGEESTFVDFDTSDATPAWSPSGETIAFASNRRGGGLFLVAGDGTRLRRISKAGGWSPSWSPDATKLAFVADKGLYVVAAAGGKARRLVGASRDLGVDAPAWSPDGKTIAFTKELPDLTTAIYLVSARGGPARRLAPPALAKSDPGWSRASVSEAHPSWSPDGRRLAYETTESIFVMNRDGTGRTRVSDGRTGSYEPAWSPDGRQIAFQCEGSVCVLALAKPGQQRRIAGDGGAPSWAPDSTHVVFEHYLYGGTGYFSSPSGLSIVDATGGHERRLTFGPH